MQCQRRLKSPKSREIVTKLLTPFKDFCEDGEPVAEENWRTDEGKCIGSAAMLKVVWCDLADPEESVASTLGYIEGHVEGQRCTAMMIDGGSTVDLINASFIMERQIPQILLPTSGIVRLANDKLTRVDRCVYVRVVVAGILATVKAYVMGAHKDREILLGRTWLRRIKAKEDYANEKLTVQGAKGTSQTIPIFPAPRLFEPEGRKRQILRPRPTPPDKEDEVIFVEGDQEILDEVEATLEQINKAVYEKK